MEVKSNLSIAQPTMAPITDKPLTISQSRDSIYDYSDVLVVYNSASPISITIADYFQNVRSIPEINMVSLSGIPTSETINRTVFNNIKNQIEAHLENNNLINKINYIVTTKGVPLRISGPSDPQRASVDSELTLIKGQYDTNIGNSGEFVNPYFNDDEPFTKEKYDLYLVTRLTGYTYDEIKNLIDNSLISPGRRGTYVLDVDPSRGFTPGGYGDGNIWLRSANQTLTAKGEPTFYDDTDVFITGQSNVMGYASWGSNDANDSKNYVLNPGFETISGNLPKNWYPIFDPLITDNISSNSSDYYSGSKSLLINRTANGTGYSAIAQNLTISLNVRHYLRGRVNISHINGTGGAHLQMQVLDINDNIISIQNTNILNTTTTNWVALDQLTYEPVAGANEIRILAVLNNSEGVVFFDVVTFNHILPHHNWVPGSIAETYVSTSARSFSYGTTYGQSLIADLIRDGVTGVKGYVYEPLLRACAHPDILFDRYTDGYNLAESYYMASKYLGWMDVVVGDPKIIPYADKLPDLNISIEGLYYSPDLPNEREEISVTSTIHNIGNRTVSNLVVKFYLVTDQDEIEINMQTITSLAPDEYTTLGVEYTPDVTGTAILRVMVDPANFFKEFFENNNIAEKTVYINNDPTTHGLTLVNNHIYRTQEFKFTSRCSDIETSQNQLVPLLETKYETNPEYFKFENEQISYLYNALTTSWEIKVTSNTSMALGGYSFRISYTDPNNAVSNYYYIPFGLRVLNNKPTMAQVIFNKTEINRTEEVKVIFNASDIENSHDGLQIEAQYRLKPADETSEAGWEDIEMISYDDDELHWWCKIDFDREAAFGNYQVRALVIDLDEDQSAWMYNEANFSVLNNQPYITNISLNKFSTYRTQSVQISVMGYDIEDFQVLSGFTCEIEYGVSVTTRPNNLIWDFQYIAAIEYDLDNAAWVTAFTPLEGSRLGNYNFRARIQDNDGYWSTWWQAPESVLVLNNRPTVNLGTIPESTLEDIEITFNAKGSSDVEDDEAELLYYWEVINIDTDVFITEDNNQIFKYKFTDQGDYQINLKVTDLNGASNWKNSSIKVENVKPTAKIFADHKTAVVKQEITFNAEGTTDTESDLKSLRYRWDFGDNSVATGKIVQHSYREPDTYEVTLWVTDDNNETDSVTTTIRVEPVSPESDGGEEGASALGKYILPLGIIVIIVIIILVVVVLYYKRKQAKQEEEEKQKALQAATPVDHVLIEETLGVRMPMFPAPPTMAPFPGAPGALPPQFPPQTDTTTTFGLPGTPGTPDIDTQSPPETVPTSLEEPLPPDEEVIAPELYEELSTTDEKPALPPPEPTGPVMLDSLPLEVIETEEHPDLEETYDKPELMDVTLPKEDKSDEDKESN